MLIEYKFKFEKNGLTVTQRVGSGASDPPATEGPIVEENSLRASFHESKAATVSQPKAGGNGFGGHYGGDGGGPPNFGTAPVTLIGPFVMCCPHDDSKKEDKR